MAIPGEFGEALGAPQVRFEVEPVAVKLKGITQSGTTLVDWGKSGGRQSSDRANRSFLNMVHCIRYFGLRLLVASPGPCHRSTRKGLNFYQASKPQCRSVQADPGPQPVARPKHQKRQALRYREAATNRSQRVV